MESEKFTLEKLEMLGDCDKDSDIFINEEELLPYLMDLALSYLDSPNIKITEDEIRKLFVYLVAYGKNGKDEIDEDLKEEVLNMLNYKIQNYRKEGLK